MKKHVTFEHGDAWARWENVKDLGQKNFMEDLFLFVAKGYMPIFVVENQWLRRMVLHQNP
jgi:hypothetical protein